MSLRGTSRVVGETNFVEDFFLIVRVVYGWRMYGPDGVVGSHFASEVPNVDEVPTK